MLTEVRHFLARTGSCHCDLKLASRFSGAVFSPDASGAGPPLRGVQGLHRLNTNNGRKALFALLKEPGDRQQALAALGDMGDDEYGPLLLEWMKKSRDFQQRG